MKKILCFLIMVLLAGQVFPQNKNRDRVKRKYSRSEEGDKRLPVVKVSGRVQDIKRERIPGARVSVNGTPLEVHTDDLGEYYLTGMSTGRVRIVVSCAGFQSKYIDYVLHEGNNTVYFTLDKSSVSLDMEVSTAQLREQQLPDVPGSVQVISEIGPGDSNNSSLAYHFPGVNLSGWSPFQPEISFRGISGEQAIPFSPSPISVAVDDVPAECFNPFSMDLFDVERVEVLKGPQSTLYGGGGASGGLIRVIRQKPSVKPEGYLMVGAGDFQSKEVQSAVGFPVVKNWLNIRAAGIYSFREGYVRNSFGGNLNGKNTMGGRLTLGLQPFWNLRMNLMVTYQEDKLPGLALVNPQFPGENGETDLFSGAASLDGGRNLKSNRDIMGAVFDGKWLRNANNYLFFRTSGYSGNMNSLYDADGTMAPALAAEERSGCQQLTQEIRYNFSRKSRVNGSIGAFGRWLTTRQETRVYPDEQYLAWLMFDFPEKLVSTEGQVNPLTKLPVDASFGPLSGQALPSLAEETNLRISDVRQTELFADATWRLNQRFSLNTGIRGTCQWLSETFETPDSGAEVSLLGQETGNLPQLIFKPAVLTEINDFSPEISFRANLKMDIAENSTGYAGIARGYRPPAAYFNHSGEGQLFGSEKVNTVSAGYKSAYGNRMWVDITGYYQMFRDKRTGIWEGYDYVVYDIRKSSSFGAEADIKVALIKSLSLVGNYNFTHARFKGGNSGGLPVSLAGKAMKLSPSHHFTLGAKLNVRVSNWAGFFALPAFSWKSQYWFDDANTPGLDQKAFGLLDATAGFSFPGAGITVSCSGTNLLEEKYLLFAGYPGNHFPIPLVMPGPPRMISGSITWRF